MGVEWIDLDRFARAEARFGARLRERLFTAAEREGARRIESLAARFAAKVAARRALGAPRCAWRDLEVLGGGHGVPELRFAGAAERRARELGVSRAALSLSHDGGACIGHVVLEADAS